MLGCPKSVLYSPREAQKGSKTASLCFTAPPEAQKITLRCLTAPGKGQLPEPITLARLFLSIAYLGICCSADETDIVDGRIYLNFEFVRIICCPANCCKQ
ncbi:unnamed protein product [Prorocentrum cordatum]|uniref:Uncharacterized protein n=1 Tax=Prorocentrum cordatum TaxID=2364126 RepID=A0ABN9PD98_9DINO|nr:unnamed protein product [Polarella glacialis]